MAAPAPAKRQKPTQRPEGRRPRAVTAAVLDAQRHQRKYDVPEDVRAGRQRYKHAKQRGEEPEVRDVLANRAYQRARWAQLDAEQKAAEVARSNAARDRRLGRVTVDAS